MHFQPKLNLTVLISSEANQLVFDNLCHFERNKTASCSINQITVNLNSITLCIALRNPKMPHLFEREPPLARSNFGNTPVLSQPFSKPTYESYVKVALMSLLIPDIFYDKK